MKTKKAELYSSNLIDDLLDSIDPAEADRVEKRMLLAARIEDAMNDKGLNKSQFAALMGKKNSVITKWLSGTHNFTADTLFDISRVLDVNLINLELNNTCQTKVYKTSVSLTVSQSDLEAVIKPVSSEPVSQFYTAQVIEHITNPGESLFS